MIILQVLLIVSIVFSILFVTIGILGQDKDYSDTENDTWV